MESRGVDRAFQAPSDLVQSDSQTTIDSAWRSTLPPPFIEEAVGGARLSVGAPFVSKIIMCHTLPFLQNSRNDTPSWLFAVPCGYAREAVPEHIAFGGCQPEDETSCERQSEAPFMIASVPYLGSFARVALSSDWVLPLEYTMKTKWLGDNGIL